MRNHLFVFTLVLIVPIAARADCGLADLGTGAVTGVHDDATLVLADGRELRLAAIEPAPRTTPLLRSLVENRTLQLRSAGEPATDRYGRLVAFATTEAGSVQEALLGEGAARVSARVGPINCAQSLLNIEADARRARRGLWNDPNFAPLPAEAGPRIQAELGRFVLVEGGVVSVRQSGGRIYVNFGRDWTRDFSIVVPRRLQSGFRAAGRDLQGLAGRRIRVRGWLEQRAGPIIEATAPEQIELLE